MGGSLAKQLDKAKAKNLQKLDLQSKAIKVLPPNIGELTTLERLNLSYNVLEQLPPELGLLSNLKVSSFLGSGGC